jgi:hypothetical protein
MTATTERAAEVWAMLVRPESVLTREFGGGPIPPAVGLDFVQDVCGDRDDAVSAILEAASEWLAVRLPGNGEDVSWAEGGWVCLHIGAESFGLAEVFIGHVRERCETAEQYYVMRTFQDGREVLEGARPWKIWAATATRTLAICRAVCAAAYPE